jgi:rRNA maturation RNase YbeY
MPPLDPNKVTQWVNLVANHYGKRIDVLNYIFVNDEEILRINREFIGHDYYTDHIGFDTSQGKILSGDTYISIDTVRTNAQKFSTTFSNELHRVIIHSVLHLCGLNDYTTEERTAMQEAEDMCLKMLSR